MELIINVDGVVISGTGHFGLSGPDTPIYTITGTISDTGFSAVCTYIYPAHASAAPAVIVITIEGTFTSSTSAEGTYTTMIDDALVDSGMFSVTKAGSDT